MGGRKLTVTLAGLALVFAFARPVLAEDGSAADAPDEAPAVESPLPAVEIPEMPAELVPPQYEVLPAEFAASCGAVRPAWYFHTEGLALKRNDSRSRTYAVRIERTWQEVPVEVPAGEDPQTIWTHTDESTDVLNSGDHRFRFAGGGRVLVGRTLANRCAFEVSYFDLTDWDEFAAVRNDTPFAVDIDEEGNPLIYTGSLFSPFSDFGNPPLFGWDFNRLAEVRYGSSLNNLECNLRYWMLADPERLQASILVGGRYMNVDESFFYHTESIVPELAENLVTTDTGNSLIGVQLGAMFKFHVDPGWWIDCEIKGAAFDNDAFQRTDFTRDSLVDIDRTHGRAEHVSTFALDLKLNVTLMVTPRLAVRGGYQALWVDGLALAVDNFTTQEAVLFSGPATLDRKGKAVYHGPHLGVTWIW